MADIAVIVVSHNSASWLPECLTSVVERAGDIDVDLVVVDSGSADATADVASAHDARLIQCANHGFAYANNRGFETTSAPWILFLNPDTRTVSGSLADLVARAEGYPETGIFGVRQLDGAGALEPSMRRFPHPVRWFFEALGSERWPIRSSWLGERVLDPEPYERPTHCDWTSGSAMLARADVVRQLGGMDESLFFYFEEPDLCLRALDAGWATMHLPSLTIVHYGGNQGSSVALGGQLAYAQRQYMRKHMSRGAEILGTGALALGYALRAVAGPRRPVSRRALVTVLGLRPGPFQRT